MNARALDEATRELRHKRRRALECAPLALLCAALAPLAWLHSERLGIALGAGAAVQVAIVVYGVVGRRWLIERLATEPEAHAIPEVREYGVKLVQPRMRRQVAVSIRKMVADTFRPERRFSALYLVDRVARYRRDLEAIAHALVSPSVQVDPVSVARCNWLLTQAAENPLYDRRVPAEDLGSILRRIQAGMQPAG